MRFALKVTTVATAVILSLVAPSQSHAQKSNRTRVYTNGFRFELGGKAVSNVVKVHVGAMTIPLAPASTGSATKDKTFRAGIPVFGVLRVEKVVDTDSSFATIVKTASEGRDTRRDATLVLLAGTTEVRRINFSGCTPVRYEPAALSSEGNAGSALRETLDLAPQSVDIVETTSRGISAADSVARSYGFTVDIQGASAGASSDNSWKKWQGGGVQFQTQPAAASGTDRFKSAASGAREITEIELSGPLGAQSRRPMLEWIRDTAKGTSAARNVVVNILGRDGKVTGSRTYFDCLITSYSLTPLNADNQDEELIERITIKPNRYETK